MFKDQNTKCLAMFRELTVNLNNGTIGTCCKYLKKPLKLLDGLVTEDIEKSRQEIINGVRPKECADCWIKEDSGAISFRERLNDRYELDGLDLNRYSKGDSTVKKLELNFSNTCNLKCVYCGPHSSTKWEEEMSRFGDFSDLSFQFNSLTWYDITKTVNIREKDNTFILQFWEKFPSVYEGLEKINVSGGEPLLSRNFWRLLDFIIDNPKEDLIVSFPTNGMYSKSLLNRIIEYLKKLKGKVKDIHIAFSVDGYGKRGEYSRYGFDHKEFWNNVKTIDSELRGINVIFHVTCSIFSLSSLSKINEKVLEIYNISGNEISYYWDILTMPSFLSPQIIDMGKSKEVIMDIFKSSLNLEKKFETLDYKGLISFLRIDPPDIEERREDFRNYIRQIDIRRELSFTDTFPEFWYLY